MAQTPSNQPSGQRKLKPLYDFYLRQWIIADSIPIRGRTMDELTSARAADCVHTPHIGMLHALYEELVRTMMSLLSASINSMEMVGYLEDYEKLYKRYSTCGGVMTWTDFKEEGMKKLSTEL